MTLDIKKSSVTKDVSPLPAPVPFIFVEEKKSPVVFL